MVRAMLSLVLLAATPALASDLPYFAGGEQTAYGATPDLPALKEAQRPKSDPWSGLVVGSEVFAVSGGHGTKGGFGADGFVGYYKEFDNRVVVGFQGSAGYAPGVYAYGPRGYDFGLAQVKVGYDMGRVMPYVTFGGGLAKPTGLMNGPGSGFDSVNDLFAAKGPTQTLTTVGAGVDYAVTDHLTVGVGVNMVRQTGNPYGPPLIPQPGMP